MDATEGRREDGRVSDQARLLRVAHAAHDEHRFARADRAFTAADRLGELSADDLVAWQDSVWWLGQGDRALRLAEVAHLRLVAEGQTTRAAQAAVVLGFLLMLRGELAAGSGWMQRGRSLLEKSTDPASRWYVVQLDAEDALAAGDLDRALTLAEQVSDGMQTSPDPTLRSMALMTAGTARVRRGEVADGLAQLDEAMLPVKAGRISPDLAGNLYCQMIAVCWELFDLRRAREWTAALEAWCDQFDSAVMFAGICRMHRVQLQQLSGDWEEAQNGAQIVCSELLGMNSQVVAEGYYLRGELLRLRGDVAGAEAAYLRAHEYGREPQPGLALLTLQSGAAGDGLGSLQTTLATYPGSECTRAPLLHAVVELAVEVRDLATARTASQQLDVLARRYDSDGLRALAAHASGAVLLAAGDDVQEAIRVLRGVVRCWQDLAAPYACARARLLLAKAYSDAGDGGAAEREHDAAVRALGVLGAVVDLRRAGDLRPGASRPGGLTTREVEILREVARGGTNRQIAGALGISERTVARHLANSYLKTGVSTRTAAVAWARQAGLL